MRHHKDWEISESTKPLQDFMYTAHIIVGHTLNNLRLASQNMLKLLESRLDYPISALHRCPY
ncbi:hypothetical protein [Planomicrobium sp. CPCC 101079]|uniref:hypothetical protein n=1 Tax=Planomicrobium sp. CPCC 101079 TaxID=2599618 RepID=UPI0011B4B231|nr:hypothetical protein [Planomicrobium sp. CPCC 101079]TWT03438.1 hypothetical protein FQV28_10460 [Planomicrobium sp. CPCC 101079]